MRNRDTPRSVRFERSARVGIPAFVALSVLLAIPAYAMSRLTTSVDWRLMIGVPTAASFFAYFAYRSDKRRAEAGQWRISESPLHAAELAGGWPGAFIAQRRFRHKISKGSYQIAFWISVTLHQLLALDSLVGWRHTKVVLQWITSKNA